MNQMCIGITRDKTHALFCFEGLGKPYTKRTPELFEDHIKPESVFRADESSGEQVSEN